MSEHRDLSHDPAAVERDSDRTLADWFAEEAPPHEPPVLLPAVLARTAVTRRRPAWRIRDTWRWPLGGRDQRFLNMTLSTGFVASLVALALSAALILPQSSNDQQPPQVGSGTEHVVAADGSGDYTTIAEAVAAANDGDTIMVSPGSYTVAKIVIGKDITLMGDGPREEIVIEVEPDASLWPPDVVCGTAVSFDEGCAFVLDHTTATLAGLTLRGDWAGVAAIGGAPTLQGLAFDHVGSPFESSLPGEGTPLLLLDGSRASVLESEFVISGELDIFSGSAPLVQGNILRGGTHIYVQDAGDDTVIRGNEISGTFAHAIGIFAPTTMLIEGNTVSDARTSGIQVGWNGAIGIDPTIRGNFISGSPSGINVVSGGAPMVEGNSLVDNGRGIWLIGAAAQFVNNDVRGEGQGIMIMRGDTTSIVGNTIDVSDIGIFANAGSSSTMTGNTVCGATASIRLASGAEPVLEDNELCSPIVLPE